MEIAKKENNENENLKDSRTVLGVGVGMLCFLLKKTITKKEPLSMSFRELLSLFQEVTNLASFDLQKFGNFESPCSI
jgi:hypothetical protein